MEKAEELKKSSLQKSIPEAVASVSYTAVTPNGFSIILTMRDLKESDLFERMESLEQFFNDAGYTQSGKSVSKKQTEPSEDIPDSLADASERACPKCGSELVEFEAKGKAALKCSTSKWDYITKTSSGCDFFTYIEPATVSQERLLKEKNMWFEGMTKGEATELIGKVLGK